MYCRNCGTEMNRDGVCPKCGYIDPSTINNEITENIPRKKRKKKKRHVFRKIVVAVIAIYLIGTVLNNNIRLVKPHTNEFACFQSAFQRQRTHCPQIRSHTVNHASA